MSEQRESTSWAGDKILIKGVKHQPKNEPSELANPACYAVNVRRGWLDLGNYEFVTKAEAEADCEYRKRTFGVLGFRYKVVHLHNAELSNRANQENENE